MVVRVFLMLKVTIRLSILFSIDSHNNCSREIKDLVLQESES